MMPGRLPLALLTPVATLVFLTFVAFPLPTLAQPPARTARIAFMSPAPARIHVEEAFLQGLREHGWIEGRNLTMEWRFAAGEDDRFAGFAADLVRRGVDVIVAGGNAAALAAKEATRTVPIVMVGVGYAVESGLVASLARPGGNITGMSLAIYDLNGKRLELLRETVPKASRIALLRGVDQLSEAGVRTAQQAATALGVRLSIYSVRSSADL